MREKFKTFLSPDYNDVKLVEEQFKKGYKLITIVTPRSVPYIQTVGYVYWFEDCLESDFASNVVPPMF